MGTCDELVFRMFQTGLRTRMGATVIATPLPTLIVIYNRVTVRKPLRLPMIQNDNTAENMDAFVVFASQWYQAVPSGWVGTRNREMS